MSKATATGDGIDRAPCNGEHVKRAVWRDGEGKWWTSHPTDPKGPDVLFSGEVRNVVEIKLSAPKRRNSKCPNPRDCGDPCCEGDCGY